MIFVFDQKGNSKATLPSQSLHQGSNLADEIIVLAPIDESAVVTMSARLPNGLYVYPALAENGENPIALKKLKTDKVLRDPAGAVYSAFRILVPATMTQYAGTLTVQFTFTMGHNPGKDDNGETSFSEGQTVTTTALALTVEPGAPILKPKYKEDDFATIQSYLNAANESAEEAKKWAKEVKSRTLNLRNGEKFGSLVQVPVEEEKTPQEPTREYQVLLGENPPGDENDIFEIGDKFRVRSDGSVYAPGAPTGDNDLIRRCDAPPAKAPTGNTQLYGIQATKDGGAQTVFPASANVNPRWIPARTDRGDLLVPAEPGASNAAASKAFVNSSIATNTATFRGTFDLTEKGLKNLPWQEDDPEDDYYVKNNDYAFLYQSSPSTGLHKYIRYKWVVHAGRKGTWEVEYELNSSGFTLAQWRAINSGITETVVESLLSSIDGKLDKLAPGKNSLLHGVTPQGRYTGFQTGTDVYAEYAIPQRTKNGQINMPNQLTYPPSEDQLMTLRFGDARYASKDYVDSKVAGIGTGGGSGIYIYDKGGYNISFNTDSWAIVQEQFNAGKVVYIKNYDTNIESAYYMVLGVSDDFIMCIAMGCGDATVGTYCYVNYTKSSSSSSGVQVSSTIIQKEDRPFTRINFDKSFSASATSGTITDAVTMESVVYKIRSLISFDTRVYYRSQYDLVSELATFIYTGYEDSHFVRKAIIINKSDWSWNLITEDNT